MDIYVEFKKVWNDRDGNYGEKQYFLNPNVDSFEGMEPCYIKNKGQQLECTKMFYSGRFIIILGGPEEVLGKCKEHNLAYSILFELGKAGMTMKQFIQQNERLNNVEFS